MTRGASESVLIRGKVPDELFLTRGKAASVTPLKRERERERERERLSYHCGDTSGQTFGTLVNKVFSKII